MLLPIEYAQHIIVGVVTSGSWRWYVTERDPWVLDLKRYEQAMGRNGYQVSTPGRYDWNTAQFLQHIQPFRVSVEELRAQIAAEEREGSLGDENWYKFIPSLLVDFDSRKLLSLYPEPYSFEAFVPEGWTGAYDDFLPLVPVSERYWVVDGADLFEKLKG
ncbi:MAG TPA: hypothetical protein VNT75_24275 [Symbiobacteriaceae bacterium]|nr:hypothetical protein [Symbiobacteriaceae bacterium]